MVRRRRSGAVGGGRLRRRLALVSVLGIAALPLRPLDGAYGAAGPALVQDPASLVDPLIGTSGRVNTFPGPDMPFGMLQWGPDTTPHRTHGGGYEYDDRKLSGFSLTHLSGPGCDAGGDVPILPVSGALPGNPSAASASFTHADEHTGVGYYGVTDASGVTTELTDATRAGLGRFTFPAGAPANLLLKLSSGATAVDGTRVRVVNDHEVSGAVTSGHFCRAKNHYTLHFDISFDRPFAATGTWVGSALHPDATALDLGPAQHTGATPPATALHEQHFTVPARPEPTVHPTGPAAGDGASGTAGRTGTAATASAPPVTGANGMYLTFGTRTSRTVRAAVAISYTSDAGAAANLRADAPDRDFDAMRAANHDAWNALLGRIRIGGGSHDRQVQFYTALYHALLHPSTFSDADGRYMGMDDQIHALGPGQHAQYADYSGWDTYRSQTQLMAMVAPDRASDVVTSMLNGYDQTGLLPKWAHNNGESYVMVGDPADGVIAGAYAFGAHAFDRAHALEAMEHEATAPNQDRPGQEVRDRLGYLPLDRKDYGCCNFYGPVSTQLEYDSADYAVAAFARALGRPQEYRTFAARAHDWTNVFNPLSGYLQGRDEDGAFAAGFRPDAYTGFVEGTSAQYTPMVPFDLAQLITARGGRAAYSAYLDGLLGDITHPTRTTADLSNEPSVGIPWEYDYLGQPWKTQAAVRRAQTELYFDAPVGSFGNDDLGAMSSWYVWSSLGMYPETPGTDTLVLGSPAFPVAQVTPAGGRPVRIDAPQAAPDAPYVQSLTVGGTTWNRPWLTFREFAAAGRLDFALGAAPDTSWASAPDSAPPSDTTGGDRVLAAAGPSGTAPTGSSGTEPTDAASTAAAAGAPPTGDSLTLAPGGRAHAVLKLTNLGAAPVTVDWTATAPDGVTPGAGSGSLTVPAAASAEADVPVTAGPNPGAYRVAFSLTDRTHGTPIRDATLRVAVA